MNISVHICCTLATGCAYALYMYMCICIYVCVDVYVCMYIYLYVCMHVHIYAYMHGCIYMCMCMCVYIYVYVCVYIYECISISRVCTYSLFHLALGNEDGGVQLVYESARCFAWEAIFTEGKIVLLSVSSLFLTRAGV